MQHTNLKKDLFRFCQNFVEQRVSRIKSNIADVQESLTSETKNSSGDKHETGRAMLQIDLENLGQQLGEAEALRKKLEHVPTATSTEVVGSGCLVKTTKASYYLAISAGEYKAENGSVFCISPATPIGQLLFGKAVNETIEFNGSPIKILEII
ncbi:MAG: 3-oxoacyl-ACP synthase [Flavobacteriaceae bacterium]